MSEIRPPDKEELFRISELTADGVTFRNRQAYPYNVTHADWEKWGRPSALRVSVYAMLRTSAKDDTI